MVQAGVHARDQHARDARRDALGVTMVQAGVHARDPHARGANREGLGASGAQTASA